MALLAGAMWLLASTVGAISLDPVALIGAIAGHGKGAAIGAVAGAGAGTAGAAYTGERDITIAPESKLNFKLKEPLEIKGK